MAQWQSHASHPAVPGLNLSAGKTKLDSILHYCSIFNRSLIKVHLLEMMCIDKKYRRLTRRGFKVRIPPKQGIQMLRLCALAGSEARSFASDKLEPIL